MPHHAPAENNAATATRPITTLNPGRELPGRESGAEMVRREAIARESPTLPSRTGPRMGSQTGPQKVRPRRHAQDSSTTGRGNHNRLLQQRTCPGRELQMELAARWIAAGAKPQLVYARFQVDDFRKLDRRTLATTGAAASGFACRTSPATSDSQWMRRSWSSGLSAERTSSANRSKQRTS